MNYPAPASLSSNAANGEPARPLPKPNFSVRVAEIAALKNDGSMVIGQRRIPAIPAFDAAFAGFAQGTVFKTKSGFTAVEDLQPGDFLMTASGTCEQLRWIGSAVYSVAGPDERFPLTRIMADSFGENRPDRFTTFGPAARLLQTPEDLRGSSFSERLMTPACRFRDGVNVIEISPPTPATLFHLGLGKHVALIANGLQVESYHPGLNPVSHMSETLRTVFMSLFPHVDNLSGFGPMQFARAPEDQALI